MKFGLLLALLLLAAVSAFGQNPSPWADPSVLSWGNAPSWGSHSWASKSSLSWAGVSAHGVVLTWTPSSASGATYNVYAAASSGAECTGAPGDPSLVASGLNAPAWYHLNVPSGANVFYKVTAISATLSSVCSDEVSAQVP